MKKLLLELLFISSFLTCMGIIEDEIIDPPAQMDYTYTPAGKTDDDSSTRVKETYLFLKEILGDEFYIAEEENEDTSVEDSEEK